MPGPSFLFPCRFPEPENDRTMSEPLRVDAAGNQPPATTRVSTHSTPAVGPPTPNPSRVLWSDLERMAEAASVAAATSDARSGRIGRFLELFADLIERDSERSPPPPPRRPDSRRRRGSRNRTSANHRSAAFGRGGRS